MWVVVEVTLMVCLALANHAPPHVLPQHQPSVLLSPAHSFYNIQTSRSYNQALFLLLLPGELHLMARGIVEVMHEDGLLVELLG